MKARHSLYAVCLFLSGHAATACHVDYSISSEWNTGFIASVNTTNTGGG